MIHRYRQETIVIPTHIQMCVRNRKFCIKQKIKGIEGIELHLGDGVYIPVEDDDLVANLMSYPHLLEKRI